MRISDWSSDVCSSDLRRKGPGRKIRAGAGRTGDATRITGTGASTSYGERTHAKEHAALRDLPRRGAGHAGHRAGADHWNLGRAFGARPALPQPRPEQRHAAPHVRVAAADRREPAALPGARRLL